MPDNPRSALVRFKKFLVGKPRNFRSPGAYRSVSLVAFMAWAGLGADALASVSYGPPEAFAILQKYPYLGLFVATGTAVTIFVLSRGYNRLMEKFPTGGGGYIVTSKLLNPAAGAVAGSALLVDYILDIAISICSGIDALLSFLPEFLQPAKIPLCLAFLGLFTWMNLRGMRESVAPLVPIFLTFLISHVVIVAVAFFGHGSAVPHLAHRAVADFHQAGLALGTWGALSLVLHSFSMGAGTYTGMEAVSDGIPILVTPKVKTAKRTMTYMWTSLAFLAFGLTAAYALYEVALEPGRTLNASLYYRITAQWGGLGRAFVALLLGSEALILFTAAQTGFMDGPRVMSFMALDGWLPNRLAHISSRLVNYQGVILMAGLSLAAILLTGGSVHTLVILFSLNVFLNFILSQGAMTAHWLRSREKGYLGGILSNGSALILSGAIFLLVLFYKFKDGGWATVAITFATIMLLFWIKRQYGKAQAVLGRFATLRPGQDPAMRVPSENHVPIPEKEPHAKTAVILVKGFNGLGLAAVSAIDSMFTGLFRNLVFVEIGILDARIFQDTDRIQELRTVGRQELGKYVTEAARMGFHAEAFLRIGIDIADEIEALLPSLASQYPDFVVFGGKPVFSKPQLLSRFLFDSPLTRIQEKLSLKRIPVVQIPIQVG